jgi:hypothetical protein
MADGGKPKAVWIGDYLDPLRYITVPDDTETPTVVSDLVKQASAGAALAHALYYAGRDTFKALPHNVLVAYSLACDAYGIGPAEDLLRGEGGEGGN